MQSKLHTANYISAFLWFSIKNVQFDFLRWWMTIVNIRIYRCTGKNGRGNSFFSQDTITCSRPELKTHCVLFNNLLKIPVFWRNASETPRDRWHYEADAGLPAYIAVLLWGKRSGLVAESGPSSFPGVSNGRHQNPISSILRSGWGHISIISFFIWRHQVPGFIISYR